MKILMTATDFLPNIGGIANHIFNLAKAMKSLGHYVCVAHLTTDRRLPTREEIDGLEVFRFKMIPYKRIKRLTALPITASVLTFIQRQAFDVLHCHELSNAWLLLRLLAPVRAKVVTIHSSRFIRHTKKRLKRLQNKLKLWFAGAAITPSEELREAVASLSDIPVFFIPNGVDVELFHPSEDVKRSHPIIVCPRRLVPKNGVEYLLRAVPEIVAKFPNAEVRFAGSGRLMNHLRQMANELGVAKSVKFLGHIPYDDMPRIYQQASVVVIPSLVEATSLACLEAMASGCAVVATNIDGLRSLIEDAGNGLLVEPADSEAIADAVTTILADPSLAKKLGQKARERTVADYSWKTQAQKTVQIYENFIRRRE